MAYKFQVGAARLSGSLVQEGDLTLSGSMTFQSGESLVIGDASLTEAELEKIDGITNGTAAASKAVVLDASKNIATIGTIGCGAITSTGNSSFGQGTYSGRVIVDDATEATSATDGSLQTDGGLSVAKSAVIGDDLDLLSDAAIVNFGADKDVNLTHVADTGLLLNSSRQLQFGDSGTYIHQSADGVLDLVSDTEIEINATTVDINGAIDASSTIVAASSITAGTSFVIGSADLNEADMEKLDGITNGTAAASKAVVLDANKDVSGLRDISGRNGTFSALTQGRLITAGSSGLLEDQAALYYDDDRSGSDGYLSLNVSSSASGSAKVMDGSIQVIDEDDNPQMWVYKDTVMLPAAGDTAFAAADSLYFFDATDNTMKRDSFSDIMEVAAGTVTSTGIENSSGVLSFALASLTDTQIASTDYLVFADANDSDNIKKESIDDIAALFAGTGLAAASAVMSLDLNELSALGSAGVVAADQLAFVDATDNGTKKVTMANFLSSIAGAGISVSSGKLITDSGAVALKADGDTLAEGYNYLADLSADATLTLPASPSVGDVVHVKAADLNSGANVIISKAGSQTIDDDHTTVRIESSFGAVSLVYVVNNKWRLV